MKRVVLLLLIFAGRSVAGPQEGLVIALADAKTLPKDVAVYTRYLDGTHLAAEDFALYAKMDHLQVHLLSRSPRPFLTRQVGNSQVLAVDLRYMETGTTGRARIHLVWERFGVREPYYHQTKVVMDNEYTTDAYGQRKITGSKQIKRQVFADHLSPKQYEELRLLVNSHTPVVTMDWFFAMTSVEADRGGIGTGYGYYDFLGIKNRDDFFKLAGVNLQETRSEQGELLAVVLKHNSGVAQNDRMIVRRPATDGFAWFTLDFFDNNLDERNPLLFLDPKKGLKHQAERHFATLPNGLPVVIACNDKGELQETAPDKIGPDSTAKGNDTRIHPSKSCLSCHSNGFLRDINDEVRATYKFEPVKGYNLLTSPVYEEQDRLESLYLRDFVAKIEADRKLYEQAVKQCIGQDVKTTSDEYREAYQKYVLYPMSLEQVAAGVGVTAIEFKAKLALYRKNDQLTTHILAPLSVGRTVTRNNFELLYPLLQQMTRGVPLP